MIEGTLTRATGSLRPVASVGGRSCSVCGFSITLGGSECQLAGNPVHFTCAVVWKEESERLPSR